MNINTHIYNKLFKHAVKVCNGDEDVAADCIVHLLENIDSFQGEGSECEEALFFAWAKRLIKNKSIDIHRRKDKVDLVELKNEHNPAEEDSFEELSLSMVKAKLSEEEFAFCPATSTTIPCYRLRYIEVCKNQ